MENLSNASRFLEESTSAILPGILLLSFACTMLDASGGFKRLTALFPVVLADPGKNKVSNVLTHWNGYGLPILVCIPMLCLIQEITIMDAFRILVLPGAGMIIVILLFLRFFNPGQKECLKPLLWSAAPVIILLLMAGLVIFLSGRIYVPFNGFSWWCGFYTFILAFFWSRERGKMLVGILSLAVERAAVAGGMFVLMKVLIRILNQVQGYSSFDFFAWQSFGAAGIAVFLILVFVCSIWLGVGWSLLLFIFTNGLGLGGEAAGLDHKIIFLAVSVLVLILGKGGYILRKSRR